MLKHDENRMVSDIIMFLLSTGARLGEALTATWANIDIANKTWRVNASVSKSKRMRAIPLNKAAIEVLKAVGTQGEFEHVFITLKRATLMFASKRHGHASVMKLVWVTLGCMTCAIITPAC